MMRQISIWPLIYHINCSFNLISFWEFWWKTKVLFGSWCTLILLRDFISWFDNLAGVSVREFEIVLTTRTNVLSSKQARLIMWLVVFGKHCLLAIIHSSCLVRSTSHGITTFSRLTSNYSAVNGCLTVCTSRVFTSCSTKCTSFDRFSICLWVRISLWSNV